MGHLVDDRKAACQEGGSGRLESWRSRAWPLASPCLGLLLTQITFSRDHTRLRAFLPSDSRLPQSR